eukprot:m.223981 g.223981  ORF g.223981 m.223981 type:complete len:243 (+) comp11014_c0_seq1:154-882(+)
MSFQEEPAPAANPPDPVANPPPAPRPQAPHAGSMDLTKYKTKLCRNFTQKGHCNFGSTCMFAHGDHDLQSPYGIPQPGRSDPTKYKTKLCKHFTSTGQCPFGERCGFAHGQMELNIIPGGVPPGPPMQPPMAGYPGYEYFPMAEMPPPQMKRAPVMELAKTRLCKHFTATGTCPYDNRCLFAHGQNELRPRDASIVPGAVVPRGVVGPPIIPGSGPVVVPPNQTASWPPNAQWSQPYAFMPS